MTGRFTILWVTVLSILLAGCPKSGGKAGSSESTGASIGVPRKPRENFDHDVHRRTFDQRHITCRLCHPFNVSLAERKVTSLGSQKELFVRPLKELCHPCHQSESKMRRDLFGCRKCHSTSDEIIPDSHRVNWKARHGYSIPNDRECQECHEPSYCIECHQTVETIRVRVHSRNYRYFHSVEARLDPSGCSSCHRHSFCNNCHGKDGIW